LLNGVVLEGNNGFHWCSPLRFFIRNKIYIGSPSDDDGSFWFLEKREILVLSLAKWRKMFVDFSMKCEREMMEGFV
jgi:hypothetical protein